MSGGQPVAGLGVGEPPLLVGESAELAVGAGGTVPVAELQEVVPGLPVGGLGVGEPLLALGSLATVAARLSRPVRRILSPSESLAAGLAQRLAHSVFC
jgi:hypothetical protein